MYMISYILLSSKLRGTSLMGLAVQDQPIPLPTENGTAVACELCSNCKSPDWVHSNCQAPWDAPACPTSKRITHVLHLGMNSGTGDLVLAADASI